ncbi:MAG: hypothetical protein U9P72_10930 [Campylobacterota bacterium]|nr:hypothetical protein [Campylobacterota bacterium]
MYLGLKKYLLVLMMVFLVGCSVSDDIKDAVSDDKSDVEVVFSGESLVTNTQAYKTGYFTSFIHQNGKNQMVHFI